MKVFFDNCTPPVFASTLHGFIQHEGHAAFHIRDIPGLPKGRHSADLEWIDLLRQTPERWMFITGDRRLVKNPAERAALRSAGLHGFILASGYQKTSLNQIASLLIWKWPDLLRVTDLLSAPTMHEIAIQRGAKLRPLPF
ncbi:hypothetical protein KYK29_15695 [Shinella daejeonensis]|uniref:PIN-like domain-containing protein n=1 Tax=Shinella daejeonensis TaxID=659017 RepID=UPI0020C7D78A|nr:hypothetical protein [Shinella daejeonensis]